MHGIREPMQICIHWEDNSPKPVNHRLTLKEGPKVKSDVRIFPPNDILQFGFTLQTSRINSKVGSPRLTWKEWPKLKSEHIRRRCSEH